MDKLWGPEVSYKNVLASILDFLSGKRKDKGLIGFFGHKDVANLIAMGIVVRVLMGLHASQEWWCGSLKEFMHSKQ